MDTFVTTLTRTGTIENEPARWVGRLRIEWVDRGDRVTFLYSGTAFFSDVGFAFSPDGPPVDVDGSTHLEGPWYLFWTGD